MLFGPKLIIHCDDAPGKTDEAPHGIYMKFLVRNMSKRTVARNCRAYLISIHEVRNGRVMKEDLKPDSVQLPWEGRDFETRDIPFGASQYADLVRFDKEPDKAAGWDFYAKPNHIARDQKLKAYRGTYRFSVIVACDGARPATKDINVDYNGDWHTAKPYDA
jgi:hypothetical protein